MDVAIPSCTLSNRTHSLRTKHSCKFNSWFFRSSIRHLRFHPAASSSPGTSLGLGSGDGASDDDEEDDDDDDDDDDDGASDSSLVRFIGSVLDVCSVMSALSELQTPYRTPLIPDVAFWSKPKRPRSLSCVTS